MSFRAYRPLTQKKKKMNFFAFKAIANSQLSFFYQPSFFPHRHKYTLVIDIHHRKNLISRYPKIKNRHLSTRKIDRPFLLRLIRPTFCFLRFQRNFLFFVFKKPLNKCPNRLLYKTHNKKNLQKKHLQK